MVFCGKLKKRSHTQYYVSQGRYEEDLKLFRQRWLYKKSKMSLPEKNSLRYLFCRFRQVFNVYSWLQVSSPFILFLSRVLVCHKRAQISLDWTWMVINHKNPLSSFASLLSKCLFYPVWRFCNIDWYRIECPEVIQGGPSSFFRWSLPKAKALSELKKFLDEF